MTRKRLLVVCLTGLPALGWTISSVGETKGKSSDAKPSVEPPRVLQIEHEQLHRDLQEARQAGGQTAQAAEKVERRLKAHFDEEARYAMPPLGLLVPLSEGKATPEMRPAIAMAEKLRANYAKMLEEHQAIRDALKELEQAARKENKPAQVRFARQLMLHAENEEQVLYPATLVVGDYLKTRLGDAEAQNAHR